MEKAAAAKWICTPENISKLAYFIWMSEGKPQGKAFEHWIEAEMLLKHADSTLISARKKKQSRGTPQDALTVPAIAGAFSLVDSR